MLHKFSEKHIDEDLSMSATDYDNALLFHCKFKNLRGLTFKNCDLNQSEVLTDNVADVLGFTATLGCHTFTGVTLSETVFDLLVLLLYTTKGNDSKRRKLLNIVGADRAKELLQQLDSLE